MLTHSLPSTFHFKGWSIQYEILESGSKSLSQSPLQQTTSVSTPGSEEKHMSTATIAGPYQQQQQQQSVVFAHGTPWSSAVYRPIITALLARGSYRILLYDLPGYGLSQEFDPQSESEPQSDSINTTKPQALFHGDTSVKFQAEALAALLKHTGFTTSTANTTSTATTPPSIVAHDIAGSIVLRTHLLHTIDFQDMLLLDTNAVLPWGDGFYKLVRAHPAPFLELPSGIYEAMVRAVVRSAFFNADKALGWEDVLAGPWLDGQDDGKDSRQRSFVRQIAQANDRDVAEMLESEAYARVRCDVKILWGQEDRWIPGEKMRELEGRLNGSGSERVREFVVVPEAGHLVMLDQPERTAVEVFDWLERRRGRV